MSSRTLSNYRLNRKSDYLHPYSILRLFTGLPVETFHACEITINRQSILRIKILINITHGVMLILDAKNCSHKLLIIYATGTEMTMAIASRAIKPLDSNSITRATLEPSTLLTLTSFRLVSAV